MLTLGGELDLRLDSSGNIAIPDNLESIEYRVKQRLRWWRNEWFLESTGGVPYLEGIFTRPVSVGLASVILTEQVRSVDGVTNVSDVVAVIDPATRTLTWQASVHTDFGTFPIESVT